MAHTVYTGKSGPVSITFAGSNIPTGWRRITITENGKPAAEQLDITKAGDSAYTYMDDPLGGKGQASCTVEVEGFLSVTDYHDTGILTKAIDSTGNVVVQKGSTGSDKFTLTSAIFRSFQTGTPVTNVVPYTATFAHDGSSGTWSTV